MTDQTIIGRLRERASKARRTVAECADATSAPRPNYEDEDGHEHYKPCDLCVSAVLDAQAMEEAAAALERAYAARDAAEQRRKEALIMAAQASFQRDAAIRERDEARAALTSHPSGDRP